MDITTQTASAASIVTNRITKSYSEVSVDQKRIILYKSKVEVTERNFKLLQVLELLSDLDKKMKLEGLICKISLSILKKRVLVRRN